jgi:hypothetical protein
MALLRHVREVFIMKYTLAGKQNEYIKNLGEQLQKLGYEVSQQETDIFVYCIDPENFAQDDYEKMAKVYEETALNLLKSVGRILPKMEKGKKRLCFVTKTASSINYTETTEGFEKIVMAACNMAITTLFNRLNPEGFTFRVFAAENFETECPSYAAEYFLADRSMEESSHRHSDEKRIAMRNWCEREIAW